MRRFVLLLCLLLAAGGLSAQTPRRDIRQDPTRAGANYHSYEFRDWPSTPVPEGFKPFYVSHYGRHGSRNLTHDSFKYPIAKLRLLRSKELLNGDGERVLTAMENLYDLTKGNWGELSVRGKAEHARIAREMAACYPEVFSGPATVRARSSYAARCISSMEAFIGALQEFNPGLTADTEAGKQFRYYINDIGKEVAYPSSAVIDSLKEARTELEPLLAPLVTDYPSAAALIGHPAKFSWELKECSLITQCMDAELQLLEQIPLALLLDYWRTKNTQLWLRHGQSVTYGARRVPLARNLALDFVHKADSVIAFGGYAADLRFGHDSALIPLMCYLRADHFDRQIPDDATDSWHSYELIPMASNLQMVFYRDPVGRVLVKLVYNGRETRIPALGKGPYYSWPLLRSYVLSLEVLPGQAVR